jgi:hypothetical protein
MQDALQCPIGDLVELLARHRDGIDGGVFPARERAASGRDQGCLSPGADDLFAVVQAAAEIEARFADMDQPDHEPGHAGPLLDRLVARTVGDDLTRERVGLAASVGAHARAFPQVAVAGLGLLRRRGHQRFSQREDTTRPPNDDGFAVIAATALSHSARVAYLVGPVATTCQPNTTAMMMGANMDAPIRKPPSRRLVIA